MKAKLFIFTLLWSLTLGCFSSPSVSEPRTENKILVATGYDMSNDRKVEVIDLDNPSQSCTLPDFPSELHGAVGGFTSSGPMVCSGHYGRDDDYSGSGRTADCYSLGIDGQLFQKNELTLDTARFDASSIVTEDGKMIIIGGSYGNGRLADTEIINVPESKTEDGFELPHDIDEHCSVLIDSTTVMVLGGIGGGAVTPLKSTYFINLETLQVTPGPEMQEARKEFGCAVFEHNQERFVIAAGGTVGSWPPTDSTEFFNLNSKIWSRGPSLPVKMYGFPLVSTSKGILAVGGYDATNFRHKNEITQLKCPEGQEVSDCQWDDLPQKMESWRMKHVAIPLPAGYDPCNGNILLRAWLSRAHPFRAGHFAPVPFQAYPISGPSVPFRARPILAPSHFVPSSPYLGQSHFGPVRFMPVPFRAHPISSLTFPYATIKKSTRNTKQD